MKEFIEKMKKSWIVCAIAAILVGVVLVVFPEGTLTVINYVIGGLAIAMGIVRVVRYFQMERTYPFLFQSDLVVGLISIGLGLFLLIRTDAVLTMIPFLFGLLLIGCGVGCVLRALDAKRDGLGNWPVLLILAVLTVGVGGVILYNPFASLEVCVIVIGCGLIFLGVSDIVTLLLIGKRMEAWRKARP